MPYYGFGFRPFGEHPFGEVDWAYIVLWEELPPDVKEQDAAQGYPYRTFVKGMAPSFQWMRNHLQRFKTIIDPRSIRRDMLLWFGQNFGIEVDLAEPEGYQRARLALAARWNIVKGTVESYIVLCRVHGFEVTVTGLWWNGTDLTTVPPFVYREGPTHTRTVPADTRYQIWLGCAPMRPGSLDMDIGTVTDIADDGAGNVTGTGVASGTIDYGWGYIDVTLTGVITGDPIANYASVVGGCAETCNKCRTHRIRLDIVPGDIGGQTELTIGEAFQRLYRKLGVHSGDGVIPVHVELEYSTLSGNPILSVGNRFDIIVGDVIALDKGLGWSAP